MNEMKYTNKRIKKKTAEQVFCQKREKNAEKPHITNKTKTL